MQPLVTVYSSPTTLSCQRKAAVQLPVKCDHNRMGQSAKSPAWWSPAQPQVWLERPYIGLTVASRTASVPHRDAPTYRQAQARQGRGDIAFCILADLRACGVAHIIRLIAHLAKPRKGTRLPDTLMHLTTRWLRTIPSLRLRCRSRYKGHTSSVTHRDHRWWITALPLCHLSRTT
jgi:hypothetical protein